MTIETKVRDYVLENWLFTDDQSALANDDSFLARGILDSTAVLELVTFLEEEFHVMVEVHELVLENFDSVNKIARFVAMRQALATDALGEHADTQDMGQTTALGIGKKQMQGV